MAFAALILTAIVGSASAQVASQSRVELAVAAGVVRPAVGELGALYGDALFSVDAEATVIVTDAGVEVFAGVARAEGQGEGTEVFGRSNLAGAVTFRQLTGRFGAGGRFAVGRWAVHVAGGLRVDMYRESLKEQNLEVSGHSVGVLGQLNVVRGVSKHVGMFGRGELSHPFSTDFDSGLGGDGRLGFALGAGLAFLF